MANIGIPEASEEERAELESVLRSRILLRSPSVLRIAEYIARTYIEGRSENIKEYNIAVDALGKPAEFDPKRESIVRVEVHRLRKKIDEFYRTEGASHKLRLVIDPGKYVPRFELKDPGEMEICPMAEEVVPEPEPAVVPAALGMSHQQRTAMWLAAAAALALLLAVWWRNPLRPVPTPDPIFLIAGAPPEMVATADTGVVVHGDRWFHGGSAIYPGPAFSFGPGVTQTGQRHGNFDYDIPLAGIPWELRLYFGPRGTGDEAGKTWRGFDVTANGARLLNAQDPEVGGASSERSAIRVFRDIRPARDGKLHLAFRNGTETAYVNAIFLSPGEAGRLLPIRLISKTAPWTDNHGRTWIPDEEFATAGKLKLRAKFDSGGLDRNLMVGERYGTFSYRIPVSKGIYGLKLYFAESWFGPGLSGLGGAGSRRFDVYAERQPLLQDFDIFREAGHKPLVKEFHGLTANADGYINLTFLPRAAFAVVNALELVEETGRR